MSSVCLKCGTVRKSGKASCCGHGGSWFGNCGSAGDVNAGHTFNEGIRACKTWQFQVALDQELNAAQAKHDVFSSDTSVAVALISNPRSFESELASRTHTLMPLPFATSITVQSITAGIPEAVGSHISDSVSITAQGCEKLLFTVSYVSIIFILVYWL